MIHPHIHLSPFFNLCGHCHPGRNRDTFIFDPDGEALCLQFNLVNQTNLLMYGTGVMNI